MKAIIICALASVCLAVVYSTACHHDDISTCTSITCNNDTKEVACEHDVCTCVDAPPSCQTKVDCITLTCKHGETVHCDNNRCVCLKAM